MTAEKPRVLYVLSQFPCYDEAFLLREIHVVAQQVDTWVMSLRPSRDPVVHDEARELASRTLSAAFFFSPALLRPTSACCGRGPGAISPPFSAW